MSSNERRRSFKIVGPLDQNREDEIVGGLKNAMARGETLAKAKQTFVNGGYSQGEVELASQKIGISEPMQMVVPRPETRKGLSSSSQFKSLPYQNFSQNLISKKMKIIFAIVSASVLIGAAILGLLWEKIF